MIVCWEGLFATAIEEGDSTAPVSDKPTIRPTKQFGKRRGVTESLSRGYARVAQAFFNCRGADYPSRQRNRPTLGTRGGHEHAGFQGIGVPGIRHGGGR